MTEQRPARWGRADQTINSWAASLIMFAAILMIMAGIFQALAGLVAIVDNEFYVSTRNYLFEFDATTWGWIHLLLGLLVGFAGWGLLSGRTWARVVAITVAVLSAIAGLPVAALLPVLGAADHRPGCLCHLGHRRPRPRGCGLTAAWARQGLA